MATFDLAMPKSPAPYQWVSRYLLEGRVYWFEFTYNDRDGFYYLRVGGQDRKTQVVGIKMTLNTDKLGPYKHKDVPPGSLDVVDVTGEFVEMRLADFGSRVILRYTEFESVDDTVDQLFPLEIEIPQ